MGEQTSRRRVLAAGSAVVAAIGLPGCSGPGGDESGNTTSPSVPAVERPLASFTFEYEAGVSLDSNGEPWAGNDGQGVLTITHSSGDSVRADRVSLRGDGLTVAGNGQWYKQADATPDDPAGDVTPGDSVAVEVDSDYTVALIWEPPDSSVTVLLGDDEGPDA